MTLPSPDLETDRSRASRAQARLTTRLVSEGRVFDWGRWIRANVAHIYLGVDRNWFAKNVRPYVAVIKLSAQARAYRRSDLDARAEELEAMLCESVDHHPRPGEHTVGNGRPTQKGVHEWVEPEPAVSRSMQLAAGSSRRKSSVRSSTEGSGKFRRRRRSGFSPEKSSGSVSPERRERVLALLSEKLQSSI
jgi:hypothetical protein